MWSIVVVGNNHLGEMIINPPFETRVVKSRTREHLENVGFDQAQIGRSEGPKTSEFVVSLQGL